MELTHQAGCVDRDRHTETLFLLPPCKPKLMNPAAPRYNDINILLQGDIYNANKNSLNELPLKSREKKQS